MGIVLFCSASWTTSSKAKDYSLTVNIFFHSPYFRYYLTHTFWTRMTTKGGLLKPLRHLPILTRNTLAAAINLLFSVFLIDQGTKNIFQGSMNEATGLMCNLFWLQMLNQITPLCEEWRIQETAGAQHCGRQLAGPCQALGRSSWEV